MPATETLAIRSRATHEFDRMCVCVCIMACGMSGACTSETVQTGGRINKSKCLLCVIVRDVGQYVELFLASFSTLILMCTKSVLGFRVDEIRKGYFTIFGHIVVLLTI